MTFELTSSISNNNKLLIIVSCFLLLSPFLTVSRVSESTFILLFILILFCIGIISTYLYAAIGAVIVITNSIHLHIEDKWGLDDVSARIEAIIDSPPPYEMIEYISSYTNSHDASILLYLLLNFILFTFILKFKINTPYNIKIALAGAIVIICATVILLFKYNHELKVFPPVDISYQVYTAVERTGKVARRNKYIELNRGNYTCSNKYNKIVIIFGESTLKDRMSIYGYNKRTTPFLESIEPYILNSISPSNATRYSIPIMLTDASVSDFNKFFQSESLVSKLGACNYETFWITNQSKYGKHDTNISSIISEAKHAYHLNKSSYKQAGFDEKILDILGEIETSQENKQAFFIHLLGSHVKYNSRYPASKVLTQSDDIESQYDNSIYYTDFVLSRIFKKFRIHKNLLFVYISDHGEVVDLKKNGHGFFPAYKEEYRVPFILWPRNSDRIGDVISESANKLINAESFNKIIEYIVGLEREMKISYADDILSLSPKNRTKYSKLLSYAEEHL